MISTLIVDAIIVPTEAILEFDQAYEEVSASTFRRTASGAGINRTLWSGKLVTEISGKGWAPSALEGLAVDTTHTVACAMPRSASAAGASITLPAARRVDAGHVPIGFALVGDLLVETAITGITDNVATLTAVAGATGYRVHYWPLITAVITRNTSRGRSDANFEWSIVAEEV